MGYDIVSYMMAGYELVSIGFNTKTGYQRLIDTSPKQK